MESPFAIAAFCGARPYTSVVGLEITPFDSWRRRRWRQSSLLFREAADVDSCCCPLILLAVPIDNARRSRREARHIRHEEENC